MMEDTDVEDSDDEKDDQPQHPQSWLEDIIARTLASGMSDDVCQFLCFVLREAGIEYASTEMYVAAQEACEERKDGSLPTANDIARHLVSNKPCPCLLTLEMSRASRAILHAVLEFRTSSCDIVQLIYTYDMHEGRLPTIGELEDLAANEAHMLNDTDDYCLNKKHALPTSNLHKLLPQKLTADSDCSICCSEIRHKTQLAYALPSCTHVFHASPNDCLGEEASILRWLEANRTCPNCKTEVVITSSSTTPAD